MTGKEKNTGNKSGNETDNLQALENRRIAWTKSKEEVWIDVSAKVDGNQPVKRSININSWIRYSAAATIILLLGIGSVMRFYSTIVEPVTGQHLTASLPDNSVVQLNSGAVIKYKPFWFKYSRIVELEGEAFFEVEKGKEFVVESGPGKTVVLGTSFNILSRGTEYEVTCVSGSVKVIAHVSLDEVILVPDEKVVMGSGGMLNIERQVRTEQSTSWINNEFFFTSVSLKKVFNEIERQYGLEITLPELDGYVYTGNFIKDQPLENVLDLVCKPFGINFVKEESGNYRIILNE